MKGVVPLYGKFPCCNVVLQYLSVPNEGLAVSWHTLLFILEKLSNFLVALRSPS